MGQDEQRLGEDRAGIGHEPDWTLAGAVAGVFDQQPRVEAPATVSPRRVPGLGRGRGRERVVTTLSVVEVHRAFDDDRLIRGDLRREPGVSNS